MTRLVEQLRRESEQLSPDSHRCAVEGLAQRGWADEFAASECERGSHSLHLLGPVEDFAEGCVHVFAEKVKDGVLPAGNSVAGRITDLHQRCIGEFSCDRDGLFDEAEENLLHKETSSASLP